MTLFTYRLYIVNTRTTIYLKDAPRRTHTHTFSAGASGRHLWRHYYSPPSPHFLSFITDAERKGGGEEGDEGRMGEVGEKYRKKRGRTWGKMVEYFGINSWTQPLTIQFCRSSSFNQKTLKMKSVVSNSSVLDLEKKIFNYKVWLQKFSKTFKLMLMYFFSNCSKLTEEFVFFFIKKSFKS